MVGETDFPGLKHPDIPCLDARKAVDSDRIHDIELGMVTVLAIHSFALVLNLDDGQPGPRLLHGWAGSSGAAAGTGTSSRSTSSMSEWMQATSLPSSV